MVEKSTTTFSRQDCLVFFKQKDEPQTSWGAPTEDAFKNSNDVVGIFAKSILRYRKNVELAIQLRNIKPPRTAEPWDHLAYAMVASLVKLIPNPLSIFDEIERLLDKRGVVNLSRRNAEYFKNIFSGDIDSLRLAIRYAGEIMQINRFFKQPDQWAERDIFQKENAYASDILRNQAIRNACSWLSGMYKELKAPDSSSGIIRPHPEPEAVQGRDMQSLTPAEQFNRRLVLFCIENGMSGMTSKFKPIALPFRFETSPYHVSVQIPKYMSFDFKRDFPIDVYRVLNKRRILFMPASWPHTPGRVPRDNYFEIEKSYCDLIQTASDNALDISWVYEELNKTYRIIQAEGPDDIYHVIRRFLQGMGLPTLKI